MIKSLKVILWDKEIGRLSWDERRRTSYFTYNPDFIKTGLDVSPLAAPIGGVRSYAPVWGEEAKIYQKLPAFLADSLPDAWGNHSIIWQTLTSTRLTNCRSSANEEWVHWNFSRRHQEEKGRIRLR